MLLTKKTKWLSQTRTMKEASNQCSQTIKELIPAIKNFRVTSKELDTEIKLTICEKVLSHQNIKHFINKKTYTHLEAKIKEYVKFINANNSVTDKSFDQWIKQDESNFAFSDHKTIIQNRAKIIFNSRIPASSN